MDIGRQNFVSPIHHIQLLVIRTTKNAQKRLETTYCPNNTRFGWYFR